LEQADRDLGAPSVCNRTAWEDRLDTALRDMRRIRPVETQELETQ
jgi:hypothetical protein